MGIIANTAIKIPENVSDLVDLYSEMIRTSRKISAGIGDMSHERLRHDKLACKVDPLWSQLSSLEQMTAVNILVKGGFMSQGCAKALVVFDGSIDMVPPPEPCLVIGRILIVGE